MSVNVSEVSDTGRLNLLIAVCDDPHNQQQLIDSYEAELTTKGFNCTQISMLSAAFGEKSCSLRQHLEYWQQQHTKETTALVMTVLNIDQLTEAELEKFCFSLQWTRESLRHFQFPLVIWLTTALAQTIADRAPDFWSWRGGTFEFNEQAT